jgi:hypothetical protein
LNVDNKIVKEYRKSNISDRELHCGNHNLEETQTGLDDISLQKGIVTY